MASTMATMVKASTESLGALLAARPREQLDSLAAALKSLELGEEESSFAEYSALTNAEAARALTEYIAYRASRASDDDGLATLAWLEKNRPKIVSGTVDPRSWGPYVKRVVKRLRGDALADSDAEPADATPLAAPTVDVAEAIGGGAAAVEAAPAVDVMAMLMKMQAESTARGDKAEARATAAHAEVQAKLAALAERVHEIERDFEESEDEEEHPVPPPGAGGVLVANPLNSLQLALTGGSTNLNPLQNSVYFNEATLQANREALDEVDRPFFDFAVLTLKPMTIAVGITGMDLAMAKMRKELALNHFNQQYKHHYTDVSDSQGMDQNLIYILACLHDLFADDQPNIRLLDKPLKRLYIFKKKFAGQDTVSKLLWNRWFEPTGLIPDSLMLGLLQQESTLLTLNGKLERGAAGAKQYQGAAGSGKRRKSGGKGKNGKGATSVPGAKPAPPLV